MGQQEKRGCRGGSAQTGAGGLRALGTPQPSWSRSSEGDPKASSPRLLRELNSGEGGQRFCTGGAGGAQRRSSSSPWMVFLMRSSMVVSHWSRRVMESYSFTFRETWGGCGARWGGCGGSGENPGWGEELGGGRERRWGTLDVPHRCRRRRSAPREHPAVSGKGRKIKRISPQISGAAPLISGAAPQRFMGRKTRPSRRKTLSSASALLAPSQCTDWGAVGGGFASPAPPAGCWPPSRPHGAHLHQFAFA